MSAQQFMNWLVDVGRKLARSVKQYPIPMIGSLITLLIAGLVCYIVFRTDAKETFGWPHMPASVRLMGALLLIVGLFTYWFVAVFTGEATDKKVDWMIRFCYTVTLLLLASFSVFFFFPVSNHPGQDFQWPEFAGPVGVVLGCTKSPKMEF